MMKQALKRHNIPLKWSQPPKKVFLHEALFFCNKGFNHTIEYLQTVIRNICVKFHHIWSSRQEEIDPDEQTEGRRNRPTTIWMDSAKTISLLLWWGMIKTILICQVSPFLNINIKHFSLRHKTKHIYYHPKHIHRLISTRKWLYHAL